MGTFEYRMDCLVVLDNSGHLSPKMSLQMIEGLARGCGKSFEEAALLFSERKSIITKENSSVIFTFNS